MKSSEGVVELVNNLALINDMPFARKIVAICHEDRDVAARFLSLPDNEQRRICYALSRVLTLKEFSILEDHLNGLNASQISKKDNVAAEDVSSELLRIIIRLREPSVSGYILNGTNKHKFEGVSMSDPIEYLGLSKKTVNVLKGAGYTDVADLTCTTVRDLARLYKLHSKRFGEIIKAIRERCMDYNA